MTDLVTLTQVKRALDLPLTSTKYDEDLQTYITAATPIVETALGGPVITRTVTETALQPRGNVLRLRTANPVTVTSVTSVVDGTTVDTSTTYLQTSTGLLFLRCGTWTGRLYEVVLTAGLGPTVPEAVQLAAVDVVQEFWEAQHAPALAPGEAGNETPQPFQRNPAPSPKALGLLAPYMPATGVA